MSWHCLALPGKSAPDALVLKEVRSPLMHAICCPLSEGVREASNEDREVLGKVCQ